MYSHKTIKNLNKTFSEVLEKCPMLVYIGDEILRQKTVDASLEESLSIIHDLEQTLLTHRKVTGMGRGLAAPQIGHNKSIFITYVDDVTKAYVNPKIVESSDQQNLFRETCLSCGVISADVKRSRSITIEYLDEQGKQQKDKAEGFLARLLQHEYDHLLGIVNVDKAEYQSIEFVIDDPLKEELREVG